MIHAERRVEREDEEFKLFEVEMQVKQLDFNKKGKQMTFLIKDVNSVFVNTLRRLIIEEVPVMSIDTVEFRKNTSALYDEIIAHRLGLIPLKTDLKSYELPSKCSCGGVGCAKCSLKLSLNTKKEGLVLTDKLKSQDPKVVPVFDEFPIVKLIPGQQLQFEATATLGKGRTHAKYVPGLVYYRQQPTLTVVKKVSDPEAVVKSCPKGLFEVKGGELKVIKDNVDSCILCESCVKVSAGAVKLEYSNTDFIVTVESFGQLTPKEMLLSATVVFEEKLEEFSSKLDQLDD